MTLCCGILTLKTSDLFFRSFRFSRQNETFSATEQNQTYKNSLFLRNLNAIQQKILPSGETSYFFTQNPDFIWRQRTEKQKFNRKENVMSERVKMPSRHFLRCDYLHIFCFIKFLVFVSLVPQINYLIPHSHQL